MTRFAPLKAANHQLKNRLVVPSKQQLDAWPVPFDFYSRHITVLLGACICVVQS